MHFVRSGVIGSGPIPEQKCNGVIELKSLKAHSKLLSIFSSNIYFATSSEIPYPKRKKALNIFNNLLEKKTIYVIIFAHHMQYVFC